MALVFIALIACGVITIWTYFKWAFKHWSRIGIPDLGPVIPFGNLKNLFVSQDALGVILASHYKTARARNYEHVGLFNFASPEYMPIDPELIKQILIKDFNCFYDRGLYYSNDDALSQHIFVLEGDRWKKLRSKFTPYFTSVKIRTMFNIVVECTQQLKLAMDAESEQGPVNIKNFLERYAMDVIGSCAFGLNCNSFADPNSAFCKYSRKIFQTSFIEDVRHMCIYFFAPLARILNLRSFPNDVSKFFFNVVQDTIEYRMTNRTERNDFFQILIELMEKDGSLTIEEVAAQAFIFFLAGFETSATTMMFFLYEMAVNQDEQKKVREEVETVLKRHDQTVTYECLNDLVYMRQALDETMRKYPPLSFLNRVCTVDYKIPNTKTVLKKNTRVIISLLGLQNDTEFFPEPEKFDPKRFSLENSNKLKQFCYLPFGEGHRACIGLRFAFLEMKLALLVLIKNYNFSISDKMQFPLKMDYKSVTLCPVGSVCLNVEKI